MVRVTDERLAEKIESHEILQVNTISAAIALDLRDLRREAQALRDALEISLEVLGKVGGELGLGAAMAILVGRAALSRTVGDAG